MGKLDPVEYIKQVTAFKRKHRLETQRKETEMAYAKKRAPTTAKAAEPVANANLVLELTHAELSNTLYFLGLLAAYGYKSDNLTQLTQMYATYQS